VITIPKQSIAMHEAGHAVIGRILGATDVVIEMKRRKGSLGSVGATLREDESRLAIGARMILAGPVVEELAFPDKTDHWCGHKDDRRQAFEAAIRLACREARITLPARFRRVADMTKAFEKLPAHVQERAQLILYQFLHETEELVRKHWRRSNASLRS
jgi:hypothetical protein